VPFYRRLGAAQPPVNNTPRNAVAPAGRTLVGSIQAAHPEVFPPTPKETEGFVPTQPVRSYAPAMFTPGVAASFAPPGSITSGVVSGGAMAPGGAQRIFTHPAIVKAATSDARATVAAHRSANAQANAAQAVADAQQAQQAAAADPNQQGAADAASWTATMAINNANTAARNSAAADAQANADAADADAVGAAGDESSDGSTTPYDTTGGATAAVGTDPATGTTAVVAKMSLVPVFAAGGAGFLVGGPIGALVGAAVGYFGAKASASSAAVATAQIAGYLRR
jgi:hypothetical protein